MFHDPRVKHENVVLWDFFLVDFRIDLSDVKKLKFDAEMQSYDTA